MNKAQLYSALVEETGVDWQHPDSAEKTLIVPVLAVVETPYGHMYRLLTRIFGVWRFYENGAECEDEVLIVADLQLPYLAGDVKISAE